MPTLPAHGTSREVYQDDAFTFVTATMTTPTDAIDTGDVVAATQIVEDVTRAIDQLAILESLTLIDVDDQKALLNLVFFDADVALGTEDAAPNISDGDALNLLGIVEIAAADYVDLGGISYVTKKNIGLVLKPVSDTRDVYMAIYTPATSTPTYAGGVLTVRLGMRSN